MVENIHVYQDDLPDDIDLGDIVAIDTEATGLSHVRDRLCLVQLSSGDKVGHLVRVQKDIAKAPNLCRLLRDKQVMKLFHFARFDVALLERSYGLEVDNIYCTKIAAKLTHTYSDHHGLSRLCKELLSVDLSKQQQSSDWAQDNLSDAQKIYAANDVLYLHRLKQVFDMMLAREGRTQLAQACFDFLPVRARLDVLGWSEEDIFHH